MGGTELIDAVLIRHLEPPQSTQSLLLLKAIYTTQSYSQQGYTIRDLDGDCLT
jgi:hypothetical protein